MKASFLLSALVLAIAVAPLRGEQSESLAERTLKQLVERQKSLLDEAKNDGATADMSNLKMQLEQVCRGYEALLRSNPDFAAAYASYGYLLAKVDMRKESISMLLKANQLDPNIALVKNQIGNYIAEEGKPLEALPYFMAAIKLAPKEPLYHFALGKLLYEARDDFLKSGEWKPDAIDHAIHEAFRQAAELAPDRIDYAYSYAESFYMMPAPNWEEALKLWQALEAKAQSENEREVMRLQEANVLLKLERREQAKAVLDTVTLPEMQKQKEKLVAQLAPAAEK